jgi:hypothetical protein
MKARNLLSSLAGAVVIALPALANAQVFENVDREAGFILVNPAPAARKAEVTRDLTIRAPRVADSAMWRETSSDAGWLFVGHEYSFRDGRLVHIDKIDHEARVQPAPMDRALYSGS